MGFSYRDTDRTAGTLDAVSSASRVVPIGTTIHTTAGVSSLDYLQRGSQAAGNPASADYLINRDGSRELITRPGRRPYHVGKSAYTIDGRRYTGDQLSAMLIGVELEQTGEQLCTWQQLDSLAELVVKILAPGYGWAFPYFIVGHYQLATPLGRRSDPQGFNWGYFFGYIYHYQFTT